MRSPLVRFLPFVLLLGGCSTLFQPIPNEWLPVPVATQIRSVAVTADGKVMPSPVPAVSRAPKGSIFATNAAIANGLKLLTPTFEAIDSFDLSESRGEVVFSAKRDGDFDIGLVAIEGSDISWVPDDPADEVAVEWAPKGNKISYIVRTRFGDAVRTVHIPTAANFSVDFGLSRVHDLAWDAQGERYAVAYSSPTSSDAVDLLKYSGEGRTPVLEPAARLDVNLEPFAGDAIVLQPLDIRYNEKLPLVIWVAEDPLVWSDARAELMRTARVALVVTKSGGRVAALQRAAETAWIDTSRVYSVGDAIDGATVISPDPRTPAAHYSRIGNMVSVRPADIESFAARYIADHLKRNPPPNGDSLR